MILYSYIFVMVHKWYVKSKDSTPGVYSLGVVTILQSFTALALIILPSRLKHQRFPIENKTVFIIALIVMLLNYLYFYKQHSPKEIEEKINNLEPHKLKLLNKLTWLHVAITVILFIVGINLPVK